MEFRPCGDCHECCTGKLAGNQYGNQMYPDRKCVFLVGDCSIHVTRPESCAKYQCAWAQRLFPEWMRPDQCGVVISVERKGVGNKLKVVGVASEEVLFEVESFRKTHGCVVEGVESAKINGKSDSC